MQFAAEVNWLADHVRWEMEEDLARVLGDAPAHTLAQGLRAMGDAVRRFIGLVPGARPPAPPAAGGGQ